MRQGLILDIFYWITGGSVSNEDLMISLFTTGVLLFVLFPVHECAHAFAAKFLGDDTAERQGRLTLNPLVHLDKVGTIFILLFRMGWAKPVPVNPRRCRKVSAKAAMVITALAGPLSNIIMAYIFLLASKFVLYIGDEMTSTMVLTSWALFFVSIRSLYLAVFNLIPIPPLDGSYVLRYFIPARWDYKLVQYQQIITVVFFMLLFATPLFGYIIAPVGDVMMKGLDFLSGFAGKTPWIL